MSAWDQLRDAIDAHAPDAALRPGASADQFALAEAALGVSLPDDFRRAWSEQEGVQGFIAYTELVSLDNMVALHREMLGFLEDGHDGGLEWRAQGPVRPLYFDPAWIPFAVLHESGDLRCIDLNPTEDGRVGQVIRVTDKLEDRQVVAEGIGGFLDLLGSELEEYAAEEAEEAAAASAEPDPAERAALEEMLARYRAAGLDLGHADDDAMSRDPTFVMGYAWDAELQAAWVFLSRMPGFQGRGWEGHGGPVRAFRNAVRQCQIDFDPERDCPAAAAELGGRGASNAEVLDVLVPALNQHLADMGDPRRVYRLNGKGTHYYLRYVVLTEAQRRSLDEARLVSFAERANDQNDDVRAALKKLAIGAAVTCVAIVLLYFLTR
ncbi:MAG: SMI1/KNR4 family protein [Deltaproteobacteria bacterium]|nr:SMI1/KNR4 family protein [Deltaproteobacteria bacterium]